MSVSTLFISSGKRLNCIEAFGLSKSGKTTHLRGLKARNHNVLMVQNSVFKKVIFFIRFFFKNPLTSIYLFYALNSNNIFNNLSFKEKLTILKMRNFYLAAVLAKIDFISNMKKTCIVDEFSLQSLFMIFSTKSSEDKIKKVMSKLPKSKEVLLFEESQKTRHERIKSVKNPATKLNSYYKQKWIENCEYNYELIKKILLSFYSIKKI